MDLNVPRRKRPRKFTGVKLTLAALFLLAAVLSVFLTINLGPAMSAYAEERVKVVAAKAMYDAILDSLKDETSYSELVEVRETGSKVYMLRANTRSMNLLAAKTAESALKRISEMGEQGVSVPLGTISGISFLSGKGPRIKVTFTPAGSVVTSFRSEFATAGINQTLHRIKLHMTATVSVVLPGMLKSIQVNTETTIAENVIVGDVPQVFTNVESTEDMLNLIPTEVLPPP